ncbi:MAG: hypothetical protein UY04_C0008G0001, partial [Parcubacteria group bacterium GW2011_GWA2_47_7]
MWTILLNALILSFTLQIPYGLHLTVMNLKKQLMSLTRDREDLEFKPKFV